MSALSENKSKYASVAWYTLVSLTMGAAILSALFIGYYVGFNDSVTYCMQDLQDNGKIDGSNHSR